MISMDEVRHIFMMDNDKAGGHQEISEDFPGGRPLHVKTRGQSRVEVKDGDSHWFDPQTAHARAGDTGYEVRLPDTCGLCKATELAKEATPRKQSPNKTEAS